MNARADHYPDASIESLRLPPHSVEAEQAVLGGLLLNNAAWDRIGDLIGERDFYRADHRALWSVITQQIEENKPADPLTLTDALKRSGKLTDVGGLVYLHSLAMGTASAVNIRRYAEIVRDHAIARRLAEVGTTIADNAYNSHGRDVIQLLHEAEQRILEVGQVEGRADSFSKMNGALAEAMARLDELHKNPNSVTGRATGFTDLDEMTTGLQDGDLIVIAGRPSMGKTTLALNIAENVGLDLKLPVLIFSMEMSRVQLATRFISARGRVDGHKLRTGRGLGQADWDRMGSTLGALNESPIEIDETGGLTAMELRARSRRKWREYGGLGLIVIDYLQLMAGDDERAENRATELGNITRTLKLMAKELSCPVIALSQLNRGIEARANRRPTMGDLRDSGAIEQDADLIFFIYRDEVYNEESPDKGIAEIIIGKQRNGPIGTVKLTFLGHLTRFENYAGIQSPAGYSQPKPRPRRALSVPKDD